MIKEAECWLILEEEQINSSLIACLFKKVPATENLCSSSPPLIVCRTASKNPADLKLVVLVGLALYYLRHSCDQSPAYKTCLLKASSWRYGLFLQHWNGFCLAAFIPNFASLALLWPLLWALQKNDEKPASITRSFKWSQAKADLSLHQVSSFMHLQYTLLLCWSLPQCCLNIPFVVKTF